MIRFYLKNFFYSVVLLSTAVMLQSCRFPGSAVRSPSGESIVQAPTFVDTPQGLIETKPVEVVRIVSSEEILNNLISVSGLGEPTERTRNDFKLWRTLFSESGEADSINAPMWTGIVNISGSVCADLVAAESIQASSNRRFFNQIDFTKGPDFMTDTAVEDVIRRLARSAWARNEKPEEIAIVKQALGSFTGSLKDDTKLAMLTTCTGIFAALETNIK
ncbi:MAG: hypothetical protein V4736_07285 [Bdellovibrionota bacterium]